MPVRDSERCREIGDFGARQRVFFDPRDRGADQSAHRVDGREAGRSFRPATKAWPKTRSLRGRRVGIEAHVLAFWRPRRTDGTAIDVGRGDTHEKSAVEAAVAGTHSAKTSVGVE